MSVCKKKHIKIIKKERAVSVCKKKTYKKKRAVSVCKKHIKIIKKRENCECVHFIGSLLFRKVPPSTPSILTLMTPRGDT